MLGQREEAGEAIRLRREAGEKAGRLVRTQAGRLADSLRSMCKAAIHNILEMQSCFPANSHWGNLEGSPCASQSLSNPYLTHKKKMSEGGRKRREMENVWELETSAQPSSLSASIYRLTVKVPGKC